MRDLCLFFFAVLCIIALLARIFALQVNKRVPSIPVWMPIVFIFGVLIVGGLRATDVAGEAASGIKTPLASIVKKPLYGNEVFYTNDTEYLNVVYSGIYPKERLKTVSLRHPLSDSVPEQAKLLKSLKRCNNFHSTPRASFTDTGFVVSLSASDIAPAPKYLFVYFPQTGELGRGKDWCDVPPDFRQWMKTLKVGAPVAVPTPENRSGVNVNGHFIPND